MNLMLNLAKLSEDWTVHDLVLLACDEPETKFCDNCVAHAKDDVDLYEVRSLAVKAYRWWNPKA
jgi:hypothetical protein